MSVSLNPLCFSFLSLHLAELLPLSLCLHFPSLIPVWPQTAGVDIHLSTDGVIASV